jgi:hypothetical protein
MRFPSPVHLTCEEQAPLEAVVHRGKANARIVTRARILLKSANGWSTAAIAEALDVCQATVTNVRRRFAEARTGGGLARYSPAAPPQRARLPCRPLIWSPSPVAQPLMGMTTRAVRLLADKAVELGFVEKISVDTIQRLLKKTRLLSVATGTLVSAQSGHGVCGRDGRRARGL